MLHAFDMDGTLLPGTSANIEVARSLGLSRQIAALEDEFTAGRLDTKGFAHSIFELWGVLRAEDVQEAFEAAPKLRRIRDVVDDLHSRGHKAIIITMSPDFFGEGFIEYGFDAVLASRFPRSIDQLLDPSAILTPADKPTLAHDFCRANAIEDGSIIAYGDSRSDAALFARARVAIAVNGDRHVQ